MDSTPDSTLPIICGGTHYFIQHFLFPPEELSFERPTPAGPTRAWSPPSPMPPVPQNLSPDLNRLLETFWTANPVYPPLVSTGATAATTSGDPECHRLLSIWQLLEAVDPLEAGRWHWRDSRKVRRGLERWWERGGAQLHPHEDKSGATTPSGQSQSGRRARYDPPPPPASSQKLAHDPGFVR